MICSLQTFAALGGYEIQDLYQNITRNMEEANNLLLRAFEFISVSPFTVINGIAGTVQGDMATDMILAIETVALSVVSLLLMVEFFRKTTTFEWSLKWENVLIFLVKIIVIKQVVENTDVIMGWIYQGFNNINEAIVSNAPEFLPCGNVTSYSLISPFGDSAGDRILSWLIFWEDLHDYNYYNISWDAVHIFYPNTTIVTTATEVAKFPIPDNYEPTRFTPLVQCLLLQPYFLIMKGIAIIVFVIGIGRVFELCVYTMFAPLPLATFASDVTNDVAKSFIKNYIACVIQIGVLATMFVVYVAINHYFANLAALNGGFYVKLIELVCLFSLAISVIKSGSWAKRICGTA
jgi:hypothetical protein